MIGVQSIEGELLRYHVAGKTVRCKNQNCIDPKTGRSFENARSWPVHEPGEIFPRCPLCGDHMERVWYLIDLDEFAGNGQCNCIHFQCRLEKCARARVEQYRGADLNILVERDPQRCAHICKARRVFLDEIIRKLGNDQKQKHESNHTQTTVGMARTPR